MNGIEMIHYLKNKVGVVDFANAQGFLMTTKTFGMRVRSDTFGDPIFQKGLQN